MKRLLLFLNTVFLWLVVDATEFRFAQLTDIHLSRSNKAPLEDLQRSVDEINSLTDIDFVLITGDITEAGDYQSLMTAKQEFDRLNVPYYVTSGNHETTWSESGCTDFDKVFGSNRFAFQFQDVFFVGFNSGPVLKMADGHVAPQDITWAKQQLDNLSADTRVIAVTHYPLKDGDVDNWYDVTDLFRQYNTQCIIGGHYHRNLLFDCDGIADVLCRSNLRGKADINGYSIISVGPDSIRFAEKVIGEQEAQWLSLPLRNAEYGTPNQELRPDYSVNQQFPNVQEVWRLPIGVGIYAAPARNGNHVYVGDDYGVFYCVDFQTGNIRWTFKTGSRIDCTPACADGKVIFGSTDGYIYCLNEKNGRLCWKYKTGAAVMGCPVIATIQGKKAVMIGGSDGCFRALTVNKGKSLWCFDQLKGYCISRPCIYNDKVYFGAWDCFFYAIRIQDGSLAWKWSNGSSNDKFSPAAVWPVASNGKVFIVAPDRVFTCLNAETGDVVYRTAKHKVRENIGISEDGNTIYSRCMWDSVQAMDARSSEPVDIWSINAGYGYEHDPSMMICTDGIIIFGTKNGMMYGIKGEDGTILWQHKIGNCVVNTICPVSGRECLITSSDGNLIRLLAIEN